MAKTKEQEKEQEQEQVVVEDENFVQEPAAEQPAEIVPLAYEDVLTTVQASVKNVGQLIWLTPNNTIVDGEISNTISVARMLSNGDKQLFEITVELKNELTFK